MYFTEEGQSQNLFFFNFGSEVVNLHNIISKKQSFSMGVGDDCLVLSMSLYGSCSIEQHHKKTTHELKKIMECKKAVDFFTQSWFIEVHILGQVCHFLPPLRQQIQSEIFRPHL